MTINRERFAKMANEELAEIMAATNCHYCFYNDNCSSTKPCCDVILQCLNQESEDKMNIDKQKINRHQKQSKI